MIQRGEISMNPARPRPHRGEAALITCDVNGRLCVGAIGRPHLLRQHLSSSKGKETEDMNEVEDIKRRAGITESAVTDANAVFQAVELIDILLPHIDSEIERTLRNRNLQPRKIKQALTRIAHSISQSSSKGSFFS